MQSNPYLRRAQRELRDLENFKKRCFSNTDEICTPNYPDPKTCYTQQIDTRPESTCVPFGYQPKLPNPGGLKFSVYEYPYQNINPPGKGWYEYTKYGRFPSGWRYAFQ